MKKLLLLIISAAAVNAFGQTAEMEPLWHIAERHNLPIIEDAAQAFGAEYQGKRTGTLGAIGCFSFYPTKNLGAFGDGGLVTTADDGVAAQLRLLRDHGRTDRPVTGRVVQRPGVGTLQGFVLGGGREAAGGVLVLPGPLHSRFGKLKAEEFLVAAVVQVQQVALQPCG